MFDKNIKSRLHTKRIEAEALRTFIRLYPLFRSEQPNANIKVTLHKAVFRSALTYACLAWELATETLLLKRQGLQNRYPRTEAHIDS
jgi:hypothetical protein